MFYFWPPPGPAHDPYPEMTPPRAAAAAAATTTTTFLWQIWVATAMKLLLLPAYHSTDLEVHRNWLAITRTLPLSDWYSPSSPDSSPSPWTLDYPPFFAYFQLLLSAFASAVDPIITDLHLGIDYGSTSVILFQRCTVILADSLLFAGVYLVSRRMAAPARWLFWMLVVWSPMLIIVDHVHFQYNGFLLGWLLLSLWFLGEGRDLPGGILFAVLLCFKHLFAVAAPVYFVYLLRRCFVGKGGSLRGLGRLTVLGTAVVAVFAAAFVPFIYYGKMHEVISRMFPFGRGLCHAYWAPNFWVFYILSDKLLSFVLRRLGFEISLPAASFTGGLVGDSSPFAVLPQITPLTTFIMVLLALSPCLIKAWRNPQPKLVARWIAYAYTCGFLFGWHVHEKAALHFVIPLAIVSVQSREDAKHFFWLSIVSCYSLFPLLYQAQEYPIKVLLLLLSAILMFLGFSSLFDTNKASEASDTSALGKGGQSKKSKSNHAKKSVFAIGWTVRAYLFGIIVIELWGQFLHTYIFGDKFPFVSLMMVSVYCAFGITYSWIWQLRLILTASNWPNKQLGL